MQTYSVIKPVIKLSNDLQRMSLTYSYNKVQSTKANLFSFHSIIFMIHCAQIQILFKLLILCLLHIYNGRQERSGLRISYLLLILKIRIYDRFFFLSLSFFLHSLANIGNDLYLYNLYFPKQLTHFQLYVKLKFYFYHLFILLAFFPLSYKFLSIGKICMREPKYIIFCSPLILQPPLLSFIISCDVIGV